MTSSSRRLDHAAISGLPAEGVRDAAYSPNGARLAFGGCQGGAFVLNLVDGSATDIGAIAPQRPNSIVLSPIWRSNEAVALVQYWMTDENEQEMERRSLEPGFVAPSRNYDLLTIDLRAGVTASDIVPGGTDQLLRYLPCFFLTPDRAVALGNPHPDGSPTYAAYEVDLSTGNFGPGLLPYDPATEIIGNGSFPWIIKLSKQWGLERAVTAMNVVSGSTVQLTNVPIAYCAAVVSDDGRFLVVSQPGPTGLPATQAVVVNTASGDRTVMENESWRPIAISSARGTLLVGNCVRDAGMPYGLRWSFDEISLNELWSVD